MVVTGCDSLNQFYMHSNLGRALQDVCKELIEHPPSFIQYQNHAAVSSPQSYMRPTAVEDIPSSVSTTLVETEIDDDSTSKDKLEGFSKITRTLDNCSVEELKDLQNNPEKLMKLIFDADLINSSTRNREDQMIRLEKIAGENIEYGPKLYEARQRLVDKYDELSQLRDEFDKWSSIQNDLLETHTRDNLHLALQLGVSEMDEKAEKVAEQFLNENTLEIEEFIRTFTEKRKLTHIRHWKQENVLRL
ncbi:Hypothetical predicted protein [Paramuricea clavata]|nr:Hypothetical predicted protein [Paramuricea clavata]